MRSDEYEYDFDCYDIRETCVGCGQLTSGDVCCECAMPLCHMCYEQGGGSCITHPSEDLERW
jgi:hypothetical protein